MLGMQKRNSQKGGSLAELAVILPFLAALVVGAADFGRVTYENIAIQNAAHEGANFGAQDKSHSKDTNGITEAVMNNLRDAMDNPEQLVRVSISRECACGSSGTVDCETGNCGFGGSLPSIAVQVEVEKSFQTIVDYPGIPGQLTLRRRAEVRAR